MANDSFASKRFSNIQALRGFTAFFIILEHIRFLNCGAFGVDIFFCLSGFMIMFSTEKSTKHFLGKRALRILPLYYCMTIGTFLLLLVSPGLFAFTKPEPSYLIKSLLFIPFEITDGIIQPLLRIGWTVNCEIFFYLLFFVAMKISHKYRGLISSIFLLLFVIVNACLKTSPVVLRFYGDYVMVEFIYGILLFYLVKKLYSIQNINEKLKPILSYASLGVALMLFAVLALTKLHTNILGFRRPLVWGIPTAIIVLCLFISEFHVVLPKCLVYLGNISFSVYLIHYYPVQFLDRKLFHFDNCNIHTVFGALLTIVLCLALGALVYELVEKRFLQKISTRLFSK